MHQPSTSRHAADAPGPAGDLRRRLRCGGRRSLRVLPLARPAGLASVGSAQGACARLSPRAVAGGVLASLARAMGFSSPAFGAPAAEKCFLPTGSARGGWSAAGLCNPASPFLICACAYGVSLSGAPGDAERVSGPARVGILWFWQPCGLLHDRRLRARGRVQGGRGRQVQSQVLPQGVGQAARGLRQADPVRASGGRTHRGGVLNYGGAP